MFFPQAHLICMPLFVGLLGFCPFAKFLAFSCTFAHISLIGKHAFSCAFALIAFCGKYKIQKKDNTKKKKKKKNRKDLSRQRVSGNEHCFLLPVQLDKEKRAKARA